MRSLFAVLVGPQFTPLQVPACSRYIRLAASGFMFSLLRAFVLAIWGIGLFFFDPRYPFPCLFILFSSVSISWSLLRAKWLFISMEISDHFTRGNISHPVSSFKNFLLLSRSQHQGCTLAHSPRDHGRDCVCRHHLFKLKHDTWPSVIVSATQVQRTAQHTGLHSQLFPSQ